MKKWFVVALALAGAVLLPSPTQAVDVAAGPAQGELSCSPGAASFEIASPAFVFEGQVRSLTLSMEGDCHPIGANTSFGQGTGQLSGDGLSCGADPAKPFGAGLILQGAQAVLVTDGICVVDGAERRVQLLGNGVAVDGQFTGVLTPDYSTLLVTP